MGQRLRRINEVVKQFDRNLFAYDSSGKVLIMRQASRLEASDFNQSAPDLARMNPQLIFALTDSWKVDGNPVEWGLEPIVDQLKQRDSWAQADLFRNMVKKREQDESDKQRANRNELRAQAADLRRDFARATNDINTSTVEKVDRRRKKDGYC